MASEFPHLFDDAYISKMDSEADYGPLGNFGAKKLRSLDTATDSNT